LIQLDDAAVFRRDTGLAPLESEVRVVLDAHDEALLLLRLPVRRHSRRTAAARLSTCGHFYVRDFRARLGDSARTSQLDRGTDWSEKLNAYYYSIRDPLICDAH